MIPSASLVYIGIEYALPYTLRPLDLRHARPQESKPETKLDAKKINGAVVIWRVPRCTGSVGLAKATKWNAKWDKTPGVVNYEQESSRKRKEDESRACRQKQALRTHTEDYQDTICVLNGMPSGTKPQASSITSWKVHERGGKLCRQKQALLTHTEDSMSHNINGSWMYVCGGLAYH